MCGIAAVFHYSKPAAADPGPDVRRMCDRMSCRGPDATGEWVSDDGRVALGHRRLSIIDLSDRASQPMKDPKSALAITFNGEIYNYRELRRDLELKGHSFHTESDTEVLLRLYVEYGANMAERLRGMFAFALWDGLRQGMLLVRDHFGIKPLYVARTASSIRVASEVKALLASASTDTTPEPGGHVGFFLWGHVPEPFTLYRGIRALPAGGTLWVDQNGKATLHKYASVAALFEEAERDATPVLANEAEEVLREALRETVRFHLVADVDVGVFLSSGLDSTTLTALASEERMRLRTVTLGFEEYRGTPNDETPLAEAVAKRYRTDHSTIWITQQSFKAELERLVDRMDQPSIDGINSYFVARAASAAGLKVAISGLGGDELFGGYPSFRQIPRLLATTRRIPASHALGRALRVASAPIMRSLTSPKYAGLLEYGNDVAGAYLLRRALFMPWELKRFLDPDLVEAGLEQLQVLSTLQASVDGVERQRFQVSTLEAEWYMRNQLLRDTDWASMSHSLEVRVPLVDWTLWKTVARLIVACPSLNKQSMARTPITGLPEVVLSRPKTGFQVPTRDWMSASEPRRRDRGLRGWAQFVYGVAA